MTIVASAVLLRNTRTTEPGASFVPFRCEGRAGPCSHLRITDGFYLAASADGLVWTELPDAKPC